MELQYEHIDWSDIADAELSGDQEALRKLRDRAAEMKRAKARSPVYQRKTEKNGQAQPQSSQHHNRVTESVAQDVMKYVDSKNDGLGHSPETRLDKDEYPILGKTQNDENVLPFEGFTTSSPCSEVTTTTSYAQMVNRNAKRTLVDRCLSPSEVPLKRSATSDIMKTPKTFYHESSPCDTTPETNSLPGKAGLVQRRLFGTQTQEQAKPQPWHKGEQLTDSHRLAQRQKQIDFGKNTVGYERYMQTVPKWKRQKTHPSTPDKYNSCSTRSWQGQIRVWRRKLHEYDPCPTGGEAQQHFTTHDAALCNVDMDNHH